MIDQRKLKELIKLMEDNDLLELDLQDGKERVAIKRGAAGVPAVAAPPQVVQQPAAAPPAQAASSDEGLLKITSPMVGTFYAAASPDAEPFANVGTSVGNETVVCIVEAMKVFNEIKAQVKGTIEKVLVENGQAVEFGQELYLVRPG